MGPATADSLWLRAHDRLGLGRRVLAVCMSAEPMLPVLLAHGADVRACDWHWAALAAAAGGLPRERLVPWDGVTEPDGLGVFDAALCDLAHLAGRDAFAAAVRFASVHLVPAGRLLVRGGNAEGIGGAARRLAEWFGAAEPIAYGGGGRIVACRVADGAAVPPSPETEPVTVRVGRVTLRVRPWAGVFAEGLPDAATLLLAQTLLGRRGPTARSACDVGCGGGVLGLTLLAQGCLHCTFTDENLRALAATRANLALNGWSDRGRTVPADAAAGVPEGPHPLVVCNPPFHTGPREDRDLGRAVVRASWAATAAGGDLYVVAHRFLHYEREVPGLTEVAAAGGFAVLTARRH